MEVCVSVCVCVRERERDTHTQSPSILRVSDMMELKHTWDDQQGCLHLL